MNHYPEANQQVAAQAALHSVIADRTLTHIFPGARSTFDGFQAGVDSIVILNAVRKRIVTARLDVSIVEELDNVIAGLSDDIGLLEEVTEADVAELSAELAHQERRCFELTMFGELSA